MTNLARALPALALAAACSHGSGSSSAAPTASTPHAATAAPGGVRGMHGGMAGMCPLDVPGTKVAAADTADGEAITFTTTPEHADELRSRVRAMADMHNRHHAEAAPGAGGGMHAEHGGMHMPPPSRAAVEDVENGARVVVTPTDPQDLQKLQSTVRMHAEHMQQQGGCGMMGGGNG